MDRNCLDTTQKLAFRRSWSNTFLAMLTTSSSLAVGEKFGRYPGHRRKFKSHRCSACRPGSHRSPPSRSPPTPRRRRNAQVFRAARSAPCLAPASVSADEHVLAANKRPKNINYISAFTLLLIRLGQPLAACCRSNAMWEPSPIPISRRDFSETPLP